MRTKSQESDVSISNKPEKTRFSDIYQDCGYSTSKFNLASSQESDMEESTPIKMIFHGYLFIK